MVLMGIKKTWRRFGALGLKDQTGRLGFRAYISASVQESPAQNAPRKTKS